MKNILKKIGLISILFLMSFGISNLAYAQEQPMDRTVEEEQNQKYTNQSNQTGCVKVGGTWTGIGKCEPLAKGCDKATTKEACLALPAIPNCFWTVIKQGECLPPDANKLEAFKLGTKQGNVVYNPKITIPCNTKIAGGVCPANWKTDIAAYIVRIYQFGLMIAGLVALGAIIYGAVLYTLSAGSFTSKEEGKEWIKDAVFGLLLLFGAYLILYTINPNLVKLTAPGISPVNLDDLMPPAARYVEDGAKPGSALQENSGASGIAGCEVSVGGGGGFISTTIKTDDTSIASDPTATKCTKCEDGYYLEDGRCFSKSGTTAVPCRSPYTGPNCTDCVGGYSKVNGTCTPCQTGYIGMNCADCASGYGKLNNLCVQTTTAAYCPSGLAGPGGTCIPK